MFLSTPIKRVVYFFFAGPGIEYGDSVGSDTGPYSPIVIDHDARRRGAFEHIRGFGQRIGPEARFRYVYIADSTEGANPDIALPIIDQCVHIITHQGTGITFFPVDFGRI